MRFSQPRFLENPVTPDRFHLVCAKIHEVLKGAFERAMMIGPKYLRKPVEIRYFSLYNILDYLGSVVA